MLTKHFSVGLIIAFVGFLAFAASVAEAGVITDLDIVPIPPRMVKSGHGHLDLIMFTYASGVGVTENAAMGFDGDDSNTDMPSGRVSSVSESYITSIGEIRDFYELNFPDGQGGSRIGEIVLFVDLSETGNANDIKLDTLKIVVDYDYFPSPDDRNDPLNNDIASDLQNSTGSGFTGGTVLAGLDASPKTLMVSNLGSGFADQIIFTGINPFDKSFADSSRILFFWESSDHDGGGDEVFLSGSYRGGDIPEPATMTMLSLAAMVMLARRRRK